VRGNNPKSVSTRVNVEKTRRPRGPLRFILLHHGGCSREAFHYRVESDGSVAELLAPERKGQHPGSVGVLIRGNFDRERPNEHQLEALKALLLDLKFRYPDVSLGAHRQVRGDGATSCPGKHFPMRELSDWFKKDLIRARDEKLQREVESQYSPRTAE
tara:strand:- start:244 stop:717 length:474 start_codon:yes stop_codon:yes gene_type:complete